MQSRTDLLEKKFKVDGVIYTVYGVSSNGVFAHQGEDMVVDSNGNVIDPKYFLVEEVEQNIYKDTLEFVNIPIRKELLEQIQDLSVATNEIYESLDFDEFVNNILVVEKQRLQKLQK